MDFNNYHITIVIPYYKAENKISKVIEQIPEYVNTLIIVDDASPKPLPEEKVKSAINSNTQLNLLKNNKNLGVGGATKIGFKKALEIGSDFIIKVDADNQMDLSYLPELILKRYLYYSIIPPPPTGNKPCL